MEQQIAVIKNKENDITDWNSAVLIEVYQKVCTSWNLEKTVSLEKPVLEETEEEEEISYKEMRSYYKELAEALAPCQILLGTKIGGVTFQVFTSLDFVILETDETSRENIDNVLSEAWNIAYKDMNMKNNASGADFTPQKTNMPGEYFFNFRDLKKSQPYVTAKETIRPFLHKKKFTRLFLLCDHKMPWMDEDMQQLGMNYAEEKIRGGLLLVIENKG